MGLLVAWPAVSVEGMTFARGRVLVPVFLNGVGPYPFLLDTCAVGHAVDRNASVYLGLEPPEPAEGQGPVVRTATLSIAGADAGTHEFLEADLSPIEAVLGCPVAGLLATSRLTGVMMLRFDVGICTFTPGDPGPVPEGASALTTGSEGPLVEGELAGLHTGLFLLDTASAYAVMLGEPMATGLGLPEAGSSACEVLSAPTGDPVLRLFLMESVSIGSATFPSPLTAVLSGEHRASFGAALFRQSTVTLGLPNRYLSVIPGTGRVTHTGTGALPTRREEGYWTLSVVKGSSADEAGLQAGDTLLSVQGIPMQGVVYEAALNALGVRLGEPLAVQVGRGGEILTFNLTVRSLFGH